MVRRTDKLIPTNRLIEDFINLSQKILQFAGKNVTRIEFLRELSIILGEFCQCDSLELFVTDENIQYHWIAKCKPDESFSYEVMPRVREDSVGGDESNGIDIRGPRFNIERFIEALKIATPFVTANNSFWIGDAENPFVIQSLKEKANLVMPFVSDGYKSIALIPFRIDERNVGIISLKSFKKFHFTENEIEFFEGIAQILGLTIGYRRTQANLRERVKELTCLYGIAQIVTQPESPLSDVLRQIVELLPPAMRFPSLAVARIVFDGVSYETKDFAQSRFSKSTPLIVKGKERGFIEVAYKEQRPTFVSDPFLKEEEKLLETVSHELSLIVEGRESAEHKAKLQEQLRHADRLATIGQLAAGVAHELNEPLSGILGFAQLIQKSENLPSQIKSDVDKIVRSALYARDIVKELLIFARQMPSKMTDVNLNKVVTDGLYFLESRLAKEGIDHREILADNIPAITADPSQLQQVLVNLTVNAIQAMPNGGCLTIETKYDDEYVYLIVEDTGVGMDPEVQKQIFIPFFTTKDVGQGTGLGLPVVHGIVSSHGGTINVESEKGKGTKFTIQLPRNIK